MTALAVIIGTICISACILIVGSDIMKAINDHAHEIRRFRDWLRANR